MSVCKSKKINLVQTKINIPEAYNVKIILKN